MSYRELIEEQKVETREIIAEMIKDGLDPTDEYEIEHHFAADTLAQCEQLYIDASAKGFEVTPPEEYELDPEMGEGTIFCFDIIIEHELDADALDEQAELMFAMAAANGCEYDGWGVTIGDDEEADEELAE